MNNENEKSDRESESLRIPLVGLRIERTTDFVAAAAFLIASVSAASQLTSYFQGHQIKLIAPDQVILTLKQDIYGNEWLRVAARMAYVNDAAAGYSGTIKRESVKFSFNGKKREQLWASLTDFIDKGTEFDVVRNGEANPFPVPYSSSVSRGVYFSPHPKRCLKNKKCEKNSNYIGSKEAIDELYEVDRIKFKFFSYIYGERRPLTAVCTIDLTDEMVDHLVARDFFVSVCW